MPHPTLIKTTATLTLAVTLLTSTGTAYATTSMPNNHTTETPSPSAYTLAPEDTETQLLLDQMAEEFEQLYQHDSSVYDDLVVQSEKQYISQSSLGLLAPQSLKGAPLASWESFSRCVGEGLSRAFLINSLKTVINKQVVDALKSRQWRVASSIIHTNLTRVLGATRASWVIKQIARKALPGGLPGQIAWIAAQCGVKEVF